MNRRLSQKQITFLLEELCVELGFCLSPKAQAQLTGEPPLTADEFAAEVIRAEGLDPDAGISRQLYREVKARIAKHFESGENSEFQSSP
jgi:hypothetical protein